MAELGDLVGSLENRRAFLREVWGDAPSKPLAVLACGTLVPVMGVSLVGEGIVRALVGRSGSVRRVVIEDTAASLVGLVARVLRALLVVGAFLLFFPFFIWIWLFYGWPT